MLNRDAPSTLCPAQLVKFQKRREERTRCKAGLVAWAMLAQSDQRREVWIRDIGEHGLGFTAAEELPMGTEVTVKVKKNSAVPSMLLEVVVIHCSQQGEHCWHVGAEFKEPLTAVLVDYLTS